MNHITTCTGLEFDFEEPRPEQVCLTDVAVALGNTCRFGGHVRHFYSVAEHAVLVAELAEEWGAPREIVLAALHHDDHEAYMGDWPRPLKNAVKAAAPGLFEGFAAVADAAIAIALGLDLKLLGHPAVKANDRLALAYEATALKPPGIALAGLGDWRPTLEAARERIEGWKPEDAAEIYIDQHRRLTS